MEDDLQPELKGELGNFLDELYNLPSNEFNPGDHLPQVQKLVEQVERYVPEEPVFSIRRIYNTPNAYPIGNFRVVKRRFHEDPLVGLIRGLLRISFMNPNRLIFRRYEDWMNLNFPEESERTQIGIEHEKGRINRISRYNAVKRVTNSPIGLVLWYYTQTPEVLYQTQKSVFRKVIDSPAVNCATFGVMFSLAVYPIVNKLQYADASIIPVIKPWVNSILLSGVGGYIIGLGYSLLKKYIVKQK